MSGKTNTSKSHVRVKMETCNIWEGRDHIKQITADQTTLDFGQSSGVMANSSVSKIMIADLTRYNLLWVFGAIACITWQYRQILTCQNLLVHAYYTP